MEALDLYKFINDNSIEWHRHDNEGTPDVIIFPLICHLKDFNELVKSIGLDEGIECRMRDGYFAFWMKDICDHYGIELNKVFDKESWDQ